MITKPKGTYDVYGIDAKKREYVNEIISSNLNNLTHKKNLEMLLELLQEKYDMLIKQ